MLAYGTECWTLTEQVGTKWHKQQQQEYFLRTATGYWIMHHTGSEDISE
jgi:hypothetical protein